MIYVCPDRNLSCQEESTSLPTLRKKWNWYVVMKIIFQKFKKINHSVDFILIFMFYSATNWRNFGTVGQFHFGSLWNLVKNAEHQWPSNLHAHKSPLQTQKKNYAMRGRRSAWFAWVSPSFAGNSTERRPQSKRIKFSQLHFSFWIFFFPLKKTHITLQSAR